MSCGTCACVDGDAGFERWELLGEWKSRICPARLVTESSREWLRLYGHYDAGHLLLTGGIADQPAIYIEAMTEIASIIASDRRASTDRR